MFCEACWDQLGDKVREDSSYYLGGYRIPASGRASISAVAWKDDELEMRIYVGTGKRLFERRYSGGGNGKRRLWKKLPARARISALRWDSGSISVYSSNAADWSRSCARTVAGFAVASCPSRRAAETTVRWPNSRPSFAVPSPSPGPLMVEFPEFWVQQAQPSNTNPADARPQEPKTDVEPEESQPTDSNLANSLLQDPRSKNATPTNANLHVPKPKDANATSTKPRQHEPGHRSKWKKIFCCC